MKAVIIYKRVSTDEQAFGFSLRDQDSRLVEYCQKNGYIIAATFEDDFTGKTFQRPGFQKMLAFAKSNKVDEILFIKWTRFSRDTTDAYVMIRELRKQGIGVQAIDEPIDFDIPQSKFMLGLYLTFGEVDNDMRADATTRGIRRALKEGKWVNRAPLGYLNKRNEHNKPVLIVDESKRELVKQLFELMATGEMSQDQIRLKLWKQGLKIAKTRLSIMLRNPVYCGNLYIKSYKKEEQQTVKGIHEPIISETLFYRVQEIMQANRRVKVKKYKRVDDRFPLNGFLYCEHEHKMTFSTSRGRHGGMFNYYHCANHLHCERCRASEANESFIEHLSKFKADQRRVGHFRKIYEFLTKQDGNAISITQRSISQQEQRIEILQDKLIDGLIPDAEYKQIRSRYESELFNLKSKVQFIQQREAEANSDIEHTTKLLTNLQEYYTTASTEGKQAIIICVFTPKARVYFDVETKTCRTPVVDPYISVVLNTDNGFREGKVLSLNQYEGENLSVARKEQIVEPFACYQSIKRLAETYKLLMKRA